MLIVTIKNGKAVSATHEWPKHDEAGFREGRYQDRTNWKTWEDVVRIAAELNEENTGATPYLPTDSGPYVSPRYDITQPPAVGDDVSYSFNGDSYPCGKVTRVSADYRIITVTDGTRYWRVRKTASWKQGGADGTWSLIKGHHNERNPHF